ncbi:sugar-phosphatase [Clostridium chauvoei]|uniref:Sugar-phosphatase n=2 Tax=Clostridium chauvoei TaxID=46867 RepID=A0ABD4RIV8_9CLOT|nr:sugar-phosphatase [Clostridium chauvoei]ATD54507.1 sugar-phosphatase [Clostridium chauvoei]ATD57811.1 HAD family hydrolase [Clostridium chauvoei]MBX7281057.1 sugar-phosphatase [Clostridium chauvoei]MBX7283556.1 sugar-phosphatase [Clostridium chauvoei]MBX7286030.1 sugar-phosphatase [Clostridium chauvoei]
MYKLIALDMDGTLLREDKSISERTKLAIQKAREKGVTVVLATGRPIEGVSRYLEILDMYRDNDYVLSYNGALVQKTKSKEVVSKVSLKGQDVHDLYKLSKENGVNIHAFSEIQGLITPKISKYTEVEATINGIDVSEKDFNSIDKEEVIAKIMMIDEPEILAPATENLPKEIYEKYTVVRSTPYFLEFLNKDANKGTGLELLAKHLGIKREEVIAMGDAGNDLHMIEYAGLGVAMGNSFEEVKEAADYITATNEEDGVAKVIEEFVL